MRSRFDSDGWGTSSRPIRSAVLRLDIEYSHDLARISLTNWNSAGLAAWTQDSPGKAATLSTPLADISAPVMTSTYRRAPP